MAKGKTDQATKMPPAAAHSTPPQAAKPVKPTERPTPSGQAKQQTESSVTTTVTDETAAAVNGNSKK